MNKLVNRLMRVLAAAFVSVLLPLGPLVSTAFAAPTVTTFTVNGSSTTSVSSGASVAVNVTVANGNGSNNRWSGTRYQIEGNLSVCVNTVNNGTNNSSASDTFNISAPATSGAYDLTITAYSDDACSANASVASVRTDAITVTDGVAPTNPLVSSTSHTTSTWSTDNTVDVSWSGASDTDSGLDGYYTEWNTSAASVIGAVSVTTNHVADPHTETSPILSDGNSHYFHLITFDNAGNQAATVHLGPFFVDANAPTTPTHVSPNNGALLTTTAFDKADWTDVTDMSTPVSYQYESSTSIATNPDGSFTSPAYVSGMLSVSEIATLGTPDGTYYWHVRAFDSVGNASPWSSPSAITVDGTAPSTLLTSPIASSSQFGSIPVIGTSTDNLAVDKVNIYASVAGANSYSLVKTYNVNPDATSAMYTVMWDPLTEGPFLTSDGLFDVKVAAVDTAGNEEVGVVVTNVRVDATGPALTIDNLSDNECRALPFDIKGTVTDPSTVYSVRLRFRDAATNAPVGSFYATIIGSDWKLSHTTSLNPIADGTYDIAVRSEDYLSNHTTLLLNDIIVDSTSPSVSITTPNDNSDVGSIVPIKANLADTNLSKYRLTIRDVATATTVYTTGWQTAASTNMVDALLYNWDTTALSEEAYEIVVDGKDCAGNETTEIATVNVDNTAPVVTVNPLTTITTSPKLTGTVDDHHAAVIVVVGGDSYLATNNGDGTWTLPAGTISPALAVGTYSVTAEAIDEAGNSGTDTTDHELVIKAPDPVATVVAQAATTTTNGSGLFNNQVQQETPAVAAEKTPEQGASSTTTENSQQTQQTSKSKKPFMQWYIWLILLILLILLFMFGSKLKGLNDK